MSRLPLILSLLLLSALDQQSFAQFNAPGHVVDNDFRWNMRSRRYGPSAPPELTGELLRARIKEVVFDRQSAKDSWAWRDNVESRLVAIGPRALGAILVEIDDRPGAYERDALVVAAFRLQHPGLDPKPLLQLWANNHFPKPAERPDGSTPTLPITITRIFGGNDLFPNHLFYAIEYTPTKERVVIAFAADGKIQELSDDASIQRFFRAELPALNSEPGRRRAAAIAAELQLSRKVIVYDCEPTVDVTDTGTVQATAEFSNHRATIEAQFDSAGALASLTSRLDKAAAPPPAPINIPNPTSAPPPMPGGGF